MASSQTQTMTSTAPGTPTIKLFSGHATVHGRCVLSDRRYENPQNPTNRLLFNANFYLTPSDGTSYDSIMGILTYFKQPGDEFSDENTEEVYDISANIMFSVNVIPQQFLAEGTEASDYFFLGDIIRMDYIGTVSEGFDTRRRPIFSTAGVASQIDVQQNRTFQVEAHPYTHIAHQNQLKSSIVFKMLIPNTPRWRTLPKLTNGGYLTVDGFGTSVTYNTDGSPQSIQLEVEKLTLQGKPSLPPINPSTPATPSPGNNVNGKKRFNYGDSPAPRKRQRTST